MLIELINKQIVSQEKKKGLEQNIRGFWEILIK